MLNCTKPSGLTCNDLITSLPKLSKNNKCNCKSFTSWLNSSISFLSKSNASSSNTHDKGFGCGNIN